MKDVSDQTYEYRALGDFCTMQRGFDLPTKQRKPGAYPLITSSGPTDYVDEAKVPGPGVTTGRSGSIGGVFFVEQDFWPLNTSLYVRDFHGNDEKYVFYLLQSLDLQRFASGAGVPTLNRNHVHSELVQIARDVNEQKRIVAVLDQAFAALDRARAHAEANLANASRLYERRRETLLNTVGDTWKKTTVGHVCERLEYGTSAKSQPEGRIPVLRMGNLQGGEIDWSNLVYTDESGDIEKLLLRRGDVLFNRTNSVDHVGKTAIYRGEREAIFAGYLIRLHLKKHDVDPEFMNIFLNSDTARGHGRSVMGKSVNQANISASRLKDYPLLLPPLEEQRSIVQSLSALGSAVSGLTSFYAEALRDIADMRQSLLQKAFSGQLSA